MRFGELQAYINRQHPPSIILNQKSQSKLTYLHFHTENTHNIKKNLSQTQTNSQKHNPKALILSVTLTQKKTLKLLFEEPTPCSSKSFLLSSYGRTLGQRPPNPLQKCLFIRFQFYSLMNNEYQLLFQ